jgi:hypothetical protein
MTSSELTLIEDHYARCWNSKGEAIEWKLGPVEQLPPGFRVLAFAPTDRRKMWTYATCGMSHQSDATLIELHLFSPIRDETLVELLTVIAHYHLTGAYLDIGHTVNFGRPWLPHSKCDHGLISLPYLDGPSLEWFEVSQRRIRFLWLIPITADEVAFKKAQGLDALEDRFEAVGFNYLDPERSSVVCQSPQ